MADFYFGNLTTGLVKRPAPVSGMDATSAGTSDSMEFLNGGAFVAQSAGTHREFEMSWGVQPRGVMSFLNEYRNGIYGTGLLYMVDPFIENHMPPHWAHPGLTARGWPSLVSPSVQPAAVAVTMSGLLMGQAAQYTLVGLDAGAVPMRKLTLLIPADRDLHLGFSGTATNGGTVRVQPITRAGALGPVSNLTLLSPTGTTRLNAKYAGATYKAVQVYLTTTGIGAATITLASSKAVYTLPSASPVLTGAHIEGEGHTGLRFNGHPTLTYIQAAGGRQLVSAAATFTEIEAWL